MLTSYVTLGRLRQDCGQSDHRPFRLPLQWPEYAFMRTQKGVSNHHLRQLVDLFVNEDLTLDQPIHLPFQARGRSSVLQRSMGMFSLVLTPSVRQNSDERVIKKDMG